MASYNIYTGNGVQTNYALTFPYIDQDHVQAKIDGVVTTDWSWLTSSTIQFDDAPGLDLTVLIRRVTPRDEPLVDFSNGSALLDSDLDAAVLQPLFVAEEAADAADLGLQLDPATDGYDFGGHRATNVGDPDDDTDAATKGYVDGLAGFAEVVGLAAAVEAAEDAADTATAAAVTAVAAADAAADSAADAAAAVEDVEPENILYKAGNLADLASPATSRTNLGLGDLAVKDLVEYADIDPAAVTTILEASTVFTTGDIKLTLKTTADSGWVMFNDGTIGNAASGGTTRANADTEDLFTLLWNNVSNTYAAVSGGRGANAAADFAANKTIALTKMLGRALAISGSGSGLTARTLGQTAGTETHTLVSPTEVPAHTHSDYYQATGLSITVTPASVNISIPESGGTPINYVTDVTYSFSETGGSTTSGSSGSSGAHANMQPTSFLNAMVKL